MKHGALIGQSGEFGLGRGQIVHLRRILLINRQTTAFGIGEIVAGSERTIRRMRSGLSIRGPPHRRLVCGRGSGLRILGKRSTGGGEDADRAFDVPRPVPVSGEQVGNERCRIDRIGQRGRSGGTDGGRSRRRRLRLIKDPRRAGVVVSPRLGRGDGVAVIGGH
jgi:hypothetical protein